MVDSSPQNVKWTMYMDCYKESFHTMNDELRFEKEQTDNVLIRVALINHDEFDIKTCKIVSEQDSEDTTKMIMKFDTLTPFEQLMAKCSSTLHLQFERNKLMYVMNTEPNRQAAIAIKSLFEKKVLVCAYGDFFEGNDMIFKGRLINPSKIRDIKCNCRGIILEDFAVDLPKYASCGFLQFKFNDFRSMCYSLLTDGQKKQFHQRAIRYIQHETKKCRACGNGYFAVGLIKTRSVAVKDKVTKTTDIRHSSLDAILHDLYIERDRRQFQSGYSTESIIMDKPRRPTKLAPTKFSAFKRLDDLNFSVCSFSDFDFSECKCLLILISVYYKLVQHFRGIGDPEQLFNAMMEYVYLCIDTKNTIEALNILDEALELLEHPVLKEQYVDWMLDLKRGKVYTLYGHVKILKYQLDEAYEYYMNALKIVGFPFPHFCLTVRHKLQIENFKHMIRLFILPKHAFHKMEFSEFYNDLSECLQYCSKVFMLKNEPLKSELAATWALNLALDAQENYITVCNAYITILKYYNRVGKGVRYVNHFEISAMQLTNMKKNFERDELIAVCGVFVQVTRKRLFNDGINDGVLQLAIKSWNLIKALKSMDLSWKAAHHLIFIYLNKKSIASAASVLEESKLLTEGHINNLKYFWYYTHCLLIVLESSVVLESLEECDYFAQKQTFEASGETPICKTFYVLLWLWHVRREKWAEAKNWQLQAFSFKLMEPGSAPHNTAAGLYLLEGCMLFLVDKMNRRNAFIMKQLCMRIEDLLRSLKEHVNRKRIFKGRYMLLKIYYALIMDNKFQTLSKLNGLREKALKIGSTLEADLVYHTELAWTNQLSADEINLWATLCRKRTVSLEDDDKKKVAHYTFPLPQYL